MKLTVVGCSGSYPGPESPASCYLLEVEHLGRPWRVLLDLGNGALGALHRFTDPRQIDAVLISHLHADHCLDLCGYYVLRKYHPRGHLPRIPVWGPSGTAARMARAYDLGEPGMSAEFDFHTYPEGGFEVGPLRVSPVRVVHPVPAYALRIEYGDRVLCYSGDSGPCDGLVEAAKDAQLFLCEASFRSDAPNPPELHLTGAEAGAHATAAGVRRLVLTHVPPWYSPADAVIEAQSTYAGPVEAAVFGASYDV